MMQRRGALACAMIASLALATGARAQTQVTATSAEPLIEASGDGEAHVAPDRATVVLVVQTKGSSAAGVATANARVQHAVIDTLRAMGFGPASTSTVEYNVGPNYEAGPNGGRMRQVGYVARNSVRVRLTQLDRIGAVIDAGLARGATGVQNVEYAASNSDSARLRAIAEATTRARADAQALARSLGGSLGPLVDVSTSSAYGDATPRKMALVDSLSIDGTLITPTELTVGVTIAARWRFVPSP